MMYTVVANLGSVKINGGLPLFGDHVWFDVDK